MARVFSPLLPMSLVAALLAGACSSTPKRSADLPDPLPRGSSQLKGEANDPQDEFGRDAVNLQDGLDRMNRRNSDGALPEDGDASKSGQRTSPKSGSESQDGLEANKAARVPESASDEAASKTKEDRSTERRKREAVAELAQQLRPDITGAAEPLRVAMPLIALETISPGAADSHLDSVYKAITPDQRRSVGAARDLVHALATDPNLTTADPAALARTLRDRADQLAGTPTQDSLALGTVALCQRVDGYGRYAPLQSCTFIAGRPAAMILYTEIENFSQSHTTDSPGVHADRSTADQWHVEIGQTVTLYFDADGSQQLVLPESIARDVSASHRHDFFLVQRIDLPKNLSVGNYNLKLAVRDVPTGAVAERAIPIRIVADASAARSSLVR